MSAIDKITVTVGTRWWFGIAWRLTLTIAWALPESYSTRFADWFSDTIIPLAIWVR